MKRSKIYTSVSDDKGCGEKDRKCEMLDMVVEGVTDEVRFGQRPETAAVCRKNLLPLWAVVKTLRQEQLALSELRPEAFVVGSRRQQGLGVW